MYYFIFILIGIIIIIAGKRAGKADNNTDFYDYFEPQNNKNDINTNELKDMEKNYENVINKTSDIQQRMDYLEQSILLLDEKLDKDTNEIISNLKSVKEINSYETKNSEKINNDETKSSKKINNIEVKSAEKIDNGETKSSENNIDETIYKLYNEGKSIDEISSILKIGKGEIQLRVGLKKQIKR